MMENTYNNLSGALYFPIKSNQFGEIINQNKNLISQVTEKTPGWNHFKVTPEEHWIPPSDPNSKKKPEYDYWYRLGSEDRFMLVSSNKSLVDQLFKKLGINRLINNTPFVDIPGLVDDLIETPRKTIYSLGVLWARVEGQGQSFRTIALYGNDLASSNLFRSNIEPMISPYRISIRKQQSFEVLTIGSRGEISFPFNMNALKEVDAILRVISKDLNRLEWELKEH